MKKRIHISMLGLCLLSLLAGLGSCRRKCYDPKNPECENYDPCHADFMANADFELREYNGDSINYETDSMDSYNSLFAKAKYLNDSIIWLIGSERLVQNAFIRNYLPNNQYTYVTCIAIRKVKNCPTTYISRDTVTKRIYCNAVNYNDTNDFKKRWPWYGTYEGSDTDNPSRKYRVYFGYINQYKQASLTLNGIPYGIPPQNPFYSIKDDRFSTIGNQWGFNKVYFGVNISGVLQSAQIAFGAKGWAERNGNNLIIYYKYNSTPYNEFIKTGKFTTQEPIIYSELKKWEGIKISQEVLTR